MCSPLHVANLCELKKVSHSFMLLQVSGYVDGWEAAMSSRQLPTFATTFAGCVTTLGLEVEPKVMDVTSSSISVSLSLCQHNIFDC